MSSKAFNDAIAKHNAIGANYKPKAYATPDRSQIYKNLYSSPTLEAIDFKNYGKSLTGMEGLGKKKVDASVNIWDVLSGTLGQVGGAATTAIHGGIGDAKDLINGKGSFLSKAGKGLSLLNPTAQINKAIMTGVAGGAKEQWKDWTDDKLSWGDVPAVGFLHGADKAWKRGSDILDDHTNMKDGLGKTAAGIGIDIFADPTTYLTGGASMAAKTGKVAEAAAIAKAAKGAGLTGKYKKASDVTNALGEQVMAKYKPIMEAAKNSKIQAIAKDLKLPESVASLDDLIIRSKEMLTQKYPHSGAVVDSKLKKIIEQVNATDSIYLKAAKKQTDKMLNDIKLAKSQAYNANINNWGFSVPMSNKTAKVGQYGEKNLMYRSEAVVDKNLVRNLINNVAKGDGAKADEVSEAIKARYGVDDIAKLTKTQFDDLHEKLSPIINASNKGLPDAKIVTEIVQQTMPKAKFDSLMDNIVAHHVPWKDVQNQLDEILQQTAHDPILRSSVGANLAEMVSNYWKHKPIKNFNKVANQRKAESMAWVSKWLGEESNTIDTVVTRAENVTKKGDPALKAARATKDATKKLSDNAYNELNNAKTRFEHILDAKNPFDARTLKTGNKFLDSMANHIADASSQRVGETAKHRKDLSAVEQYVKKNNITETEMKEAIYHLEGKAPKAYGEDWVASERVKGLAERSKFLLDKLKVDEMAAGTLTKERKNYFPHIFNKTDDELKKIREYKDRHGDLKGMSEQNKNNKTRSSFQTMAQRDDYMVKLEKLIAKETDIDAKEELIERLKEVEDLFETDVTKALTRRVREGVRANSMKAMHGELSKFGMLKSNVTDSADTAGLKELTKAEANKLGLGEGKHYMNESVLNGMKRIDEIFTTDGMNKTMRYLNATTDIWRSLVTSYKPSHYRNNIIGNMINNMAAGVNPSDYKAAHKLMRGYKAGTLTPSQKKLMDSAYKHNVVSGGFLTDDHGGFHFTDPLKIEKAAKAVSNNKGVRKARAVGESIDDVSRLANYINGVDKFSDTKKAAAQVREYLFNYNEMTNADRHMRMAVPFWNWTKRNVPLQMKMLMENPKIAMNVERFQNIFNDDQNGAEWQKESGVRVPQPIANAFGAGDKEFYTSLPSPTKDLNLLLNPLSFLSSVAPVPKMTMEIAMNKKMFTKKPISYGHDNVQPEDLPEYFSKNFGITGNIYDTIVGNKGIGESGVNLVNPIYGVQNE